MRFVVPFDAGKPKTRLGPLLDPEDRMAFARVMLADVLKTLGRTEVDTLVLSTGPVECDVPVEIDDRHLTAAVNAVLQETDDPIGVVMADLPLVTPGSIDRLLDPTAGLVIAPGRGAGTNAFVTSHPEFRVDYHGTSYTDHLSIAADFGVSVTTVDSHRLATDIDERSDLVEVLVHGEGTASREWLVEQGLELYVEAGRVGVKRE